MDIEKIIKIQELHQKGWTQKEIAKETGTSVPKFRKYIKVDIKKNEYEKKANELDSQKLVASLIIDSTLHLLESRCGTFGSLQEGTALRLIPNRLGQLFNAKVATAIMHKIYEMCGSMLT